jgi:dienelactone hydrolase
MTRAFLCWLIVLFPLSAGAQTPRVVDVPSRPGVTQRFLLLQLPHAKTAVILFAGGDGGIQIAADGVIKRSGNFLVRSRELFAAQGLAVAVIDAPSDQQSPPYLGNSRQTPEHVADVKAAIAWLKTELKMPVWVIGTSRGTQSAAYVATQLPSADGGPDGVVLTSSVLQDRRTRPLPAMALERIGVPVLVVHHRLDSCRACLFADLPRLTDKLKHLRKTGTLVFDGGNNEGDPCEARAYHGYNGIEADVVAKIAAWILIH